MIHPQKSSVPRAQKYPEGTIVSFATKICQEQRGREGIESVWIEGLSSPKLYSQHTHYSIFNQSGVIARCGHPCMTWCHRDETSQSNKQGTAKTSLQDDFAVEDCHFQASMWYLDISWVPFRLVQLSGWAIDCDPTGTCTSIRPFPTIKRFVRFRPRNPVSKMAGLQTSSQTHGIGSKSHPIELGIRTINRLRRSLYQPWRSRRRKWALMLYYPTMNFRYVQLARILVTTLNSIALMGFWCLIMSEFKKQDQLWTILDLIRFARISKGLSRFVWK